MMSTTFAVVLFTLYATHPVCPCKTTGLQGSTPYTSCSTAADPIDFRMEGCTTPPCYLYRGESATAEWDWIVSADTKALTPRVRATLYEILTINYDIGQTNACETLTNAECPLAKEQKVTYALSMPVLASYPKVSLTIEFALVDDNGNAQVCFKASAIVTDR